MIERRSGSERVGVVAGGGPPPPANSVQLILSPSGEPVTVRCVDCGKERAISLPAPLRAVVAMLTVFEWHQCSTEAVALAQD